MKPFSQGQHLLAHVASQFRANPGTWAQGWGYLPDGTYVDFDPDPGTIKQMASFCIDVALMRFGAQFGGQPAVTEARRLLYRHLGTVHSRSSIWKHNDAKGRTVEQVIDCVETASCTDMVTVDRLEQLFAEITAPPAKELAAAA